MSSSFPFPEIYIINLDSRPDRWESIMKTCSSCGINPIRVSGVKETPGWHGCAKSHMAVVDKAISTGQPWYIVLEDDATLTIEDWNRFKRFLPKLWEMRDSWDIFNGGPGDVNNFQLIQRDPLLFRITGNMAHFLLVNASGYPIIKSWSPEKTEYDNHLKNSSRMLATYPFISGQTPGISDIGIGDPIYTLNLANYRLQLLLKRYQLI